MAVKNEDYEYHGSFNDKVKAVEKETKVKGFIKERQIGGKTRYFVLSRKEKQK